MQNSQGQYIATMEEFKTLPIEFQTAVRQVITVHFISGGMMGHFQDPEENEIAESQADRMEMILKTATHAIAGYEYSLDVNIIQELRLEISEKLLSAIEATTTKTLH